MRCQDMERLMLEKAEESSTPEERRALEAHLDSCPECAAFRDFRKSLKSAFEGGSVPRLAPGLAEKVRALCHSELGPRPAQREADIPWAIWAAFGILTVITLGFLIPQILDFFSTKEFTPAMGLLLAILLQNAVTLFFAPVIMRSHRVGHNGWKECR